MNYRLFSSTLALSLGLILASTQTSQAQLATGNQSDVSGFNLTSSSQIPIPNQFTYWFSTDISDAVTEAIALISSGNYAVRETVVSNGGQSVQVYKVTIVNASGEPVTISFTNGTLISSLIAAAGTEAFVAPPITPDSNGQVAIAQINLWANNATNNAIKSFLNTNLESLDVEIVSLAIELANSIHSLRSGDSVSPASVYEAIVKFNALIKKAKDEDKLDQLGNGVYGAYAALIYIVNSAEAAAGSAAPE